MSKYQFYLYRNMDETLDHLLALMEAENEEEEAYRDAIAHILEISEKMGFYGNLWHDYLAYLIVNHENAFSMACEKRGEIPGTMNHFARRDFALLRELFRYTFPGRDGELLQDFANNNEEAKYFNKRIRDRILMLAGQLEAASNDEQFMTAVCDFYREVGVGKFGMFKAFRITHRPDSEEALIQPVVSVQHIFLDDIIGYEAQKQKLTENTKAFLAGRKANNVLLFGDSGTGKSSSIKALLNEYYDDGLRMIEVYKHQFKDLSAIINQIKDRNYKFIIYMDDLSFEEFEIEYKYLKAVIEGGLEKKPDNVLIYATSNRRHLVREKFTDKEERDDDLHSRDTVQEKLSLSARFGVSIYYGSPDPKLFKEIVKGLAKKAGIEIEENALLLEANKWELSHGGLSGRTAEQFINYLSYTYMAK